MRVNSRSLLLALAFVVAAGMFLLKVHGSGCENPPTMPSATAWENKAQVSVVVDMSFNNQQFGCVKTAFDNWNTANSGTGVYFAVQHSNAQVVTYQNGQYIGNNAFQVTSANLPVGMQGKVTGSGNGSHRLNGYATLQQPSLMSNCLAETETMSHEIGHTFSLNDCTAANGCNTTPHGTTMDEPGSANPNDTSTGTTGPTPCDKGTVDSEPNYNPPPSCGPCPCAKSVPPNNNSPTNGVIPEKKCSPIILNLDNDLSDGGIFDLAPAERGVYFDIDGSGKKTHVSWPEPGSANAWLALPVNGKVESGKQLFGNFTAHSNDDNGWVALAWYDSRENGGNEDGVIDGKDAIYSRLRLWVDKNHDGVAQPEELYPLAKMGVFSISLDYKNVIKVDENGDVFEYEAGINKGSSRQSEVDKHAWDVFLTALPQ